MVAVVAVVVVVAVVDVVAGARDVKEHVYLLYNHVVLVQPVWSLSWLLTVDINIYIILPIDCEGFHFWCDLTESILVLKP